MKWILALFTLLLFSAAQAQNQPAKITSTNDVRLPQEVRDKLVAIKTPEALENFKYTSTTTEMARDTSATPGAAIRTIRSFSFSDGRIVGQIKVVISNVGYSNETTTTLVELCYQYCCTDKNGTEHCTQDFEMFKKWMKNPENCINSRTTTCN